MPSRKPMYTVGVIVLAIVFTSPQVLIAIAIGAAAYQTPGTWDRFLPHVPGFGQQQFHYDEVSHSPMWQDKFVSIRLVPENKIATWRVSATDPETGLVSETGLEIACPNYLQPFEFGDRLFFTGLDHSFEVVEGAARPSSLVAPLASDASRFLWNGEPATVIRNQDEFEVSTVSKGVWATIGTVLLPDASRVRTLDDAEIRFDRIDSIECRSEGDRIRVLLDVDDHLLYREGLVLVPAANEASGLDLDQPASALVPANSDTDLAGWTLVHSKWGLTSWPSFGTVDRHYRGLEVQGQPEVLIIDLWETEQPTADVYRFDGAKWTKFASQLVPYGSHEFRAVTTADRQRSYLVATTTTGVAHVYAVEATGFRKTNGATSPTFLVAFGSLGPYAVLFGGALFLGALQAGGTAILMWWHSTPEYAFGHQTVRLSSLGGEAWRA